MKREYNFDLLRIISMVAVIMIHVSATWVSGFSNFIANGGEITMLLNPISACIYNTISRFAVPCFIMISGAFIIDDSRTENYYDFYKKKLLKIGIPTLLFSVIYIVYRIPFCFIGEDVGIVTLVKDIIKGSPFYHMWYLYMLIMIYLMSPIVVRFKNSISYENFRKITFAFLTLAIFSGWTTKKVLLSYDLGQSFEYLGYFMAGYVIRQDTKKSNQKGILLVLIGLLIMLITSFVEYKFQILGGIAETELKYRIVSPFSPTIVVASLFIFKGFAMFKINYNKQVEKIAEMSFVIYLFHGGIWDLFLKSLSFFKGKNFILTLNNVYCIPIFVIMVLVLSALCTMIYNKINLIYSFKRNKTIFSKF